MICRYVYIYIYVFIYSVWVSLNETVHEHVTQTINIYMFKAKFSPVSYNNGHG